MNQQHFFKEIKEKIHWSKKLIPTSDKTYLLLLTRFFYFMTSAAFQKFLRRYTLIVIYRTRWFGICILFAEKWSQARWMSEKKAANAMDEKGGIGWNFSFVFVGCCNLDVGTWSLSPISPCNPWNHRNPSANCVCVFLLSLALYRSNAPFGIFPCLIWIWMSSIIPCFKLNFAIVSSIDQWLLIVFFSACLPLSFI